MDGADYTPDAGWFQDPDDASQYRYWDGQQWTEHRAPIHAADPGQHDDGAQQPEPDAWAQQPHQPEPDARAQQPHQQPHQPEPDARAQQPHQPEPDARAQQPHQQPHQPEPDARAQQPHQQPHQPEPDARAQQPHQQPHQPEPDARAQQPHQPEPDAWAQQPHQPAAGGRGALLGLRKATHVFSDSWILALRCVGSWVAPAAVFVGCLALFALLVRLVGVAAVTSVAAGSVPAMGGTLILGLFFFALATAATAWAACMLSAAAVLAVLDDLAGKDAPVFRVAMARAPRVLGLNLQLLIVFAVVAAPAAIMAGQTPATAATAVVALLLGPVAAPACAAAAAGPPRWALRQAAALTKGSTGGAFMSNALVVASVLGVWACAQFLVPGLPLLLSTVLLVVLFVAGAPTAVAVTAACGAIIYHDLGGVDDTDRHVKSPAEERHQDKAPTPTG